MIDRDVIEFTLGFHEFALDGDRILDPENGDVYVKKWSSWLRYRPGERTPSQCFASNMVGRFFYVYGGVPPAA